MKTQFFLEMTKVGFKLKVFSQKKKLWLSWSQKRQEFKLFWYTCIFCPLFTLSQISFPWKSRFAAAVFFRSSAIAVISVEPAINYNIVYSFWEDFPTKANTVQNDPISLFCHLLRTEITTTAFLCYPNWSKNLSIGCLVMHEYLTTTSSFWYFHLQMVLLHYNVA